MVHISVFASALHDRRKVFLLEQTADNLFETIGALVYMPSWSVRECRSVGIRSSMGADPIPDL